MTTRLLVPYHGLLCLRGHAGEEANFLGWCGITIWFMVGYVLYTIEILPSVYA